MNHTTISPDPIILGRSALLHLPDGLGLHALEVTDTYWEHRASHAELDNGRVMSIFDYTSSWTWWERHPLGDEFVHVITGDVDFQLDNGIDRQSLRLSAGEAAVIPQNVWHRAVLHRPSTLLFVTPTPARTEHRDAS